MNEQFNGTGKVIQHRAESFPLRVEGNFRVLENGQVWITDKKGEVWFFHPSGGALSFVLD